MERISEHILRYRDEIGSTSYLVVGTDSAAMIDCGLGLSPVMPRIREITPLPVSLLLTHAHPDHYGAAGEFDVIRLHRRDCDILPLMEKTFADKLSCPEVPKDRLQPFVDDAVFDLGNVTVKTIPVPGHTPGSAFFVIEEDHIVLTGDAIGSGIIVLMTTPYTLPLPDYLRSLKEAEIKCRPYSAWQWCGGHDLQSGLPGTAEYNPPSLALMQDMITLVSGVISGSIVCHAVDEPNSPSGRASRADYGRAGIVWQ